NLESTRHGLSLTISGLGRELDISTGLKGMFNGANILAAVSAAWQFNIDNVVIKQAFRTIKNVPGRFQSVDRGQKFQVVIDYAHTPDGLRQLLKSARAVTTGKLIIVFGCGGDRDRDKRPLMGAIAAELSDEMIITSDNPRSEAPEEIIDDIVSGLISDQCQYNIVIDRRQAIYEAINRAKKGDMVVIAGKGHETGQIFADKVVSFNDVEEVEKILSEIISDKSKSA
ncbi:MAG TPA: UDP-N-acetylmuramoyl-L-alanyl-D-glutamate--2,6-diaminopimelate ligase, partial [Actinobacteria bacterium]|nr:UDP-N-acetylmuramoyl-L-alanyl-D-glutamate--2,6-diaminopimelate ligase [Actinomycetes bacterium]HEX21351.1 UDP-N-acetylmuramoyl-L-alanyl-D-glutamate--2,6-diaminopimelate ligase [Actinomycetota bacterium]